MMRALAVGKSCECRLPAQMKSWIVILPMLAFACERPAIAGLETSYRAQVQAREAEVAARVGGRIKRVDVHDHQVVAQGAPLIELDDDELRARVTAAQADLAARLSELQQAEAAVTTAPANHVDLEQAGLELARARAAQAQAVLELAQHDLAHATITAEIGGTITLRPVAPGQRIEPQQSLGTIVDADGAWVDAFFQETQIAPIKVGQEADVVIDENITLRGAVDDIDREGAALVHAVVDGDKPAGRVGVRVKIKLAKLRRPAHLWPGMSARVDIHTR